MRTMKLTMAVAVIALFATTTAAFGAGKPVVTTGGHSKLTQTSVTLNGTVNPNALLTSYFFQYGTSTAYGAQTGPVSVGQGTAAKSVSTAVIALKPNQGYHYRLVAINNAGTTLGKDASFTTPKQPLGLSLLATPNPVPFGGSTMINATLTGSDNTGRQIVLKERPFPYTAAYAPVGNVQLTSSTGLASFPILGLLINTQFVATIKGTNTNSLPLTVGSAVKVSLLQLSRSVHSGSLARFSGIVSPVEDGAQYAIQNLRGTQWVNIAGGALKHHSTTDSLFSINAHVRHSGAYRVFVGIADGAHQGNWSKTINLKLISKTHH